MNAHIQPVDSGWKPTSFLPARVLTGIVEAQCKKAHICCW
jgi:hypothetical protein